MGFSLIEICFDFRKCLPFCKQLENFRYELSETLIWKVVFFN